MNSNASPQITPLSEDLITVAKAADPALDLAQLCRYHSNPLRLPDDRPVLNLTSDEFIGIFDLRHFHYFLQPTQVFRFAVYFQLEMPSMIAILLKASWEMHLAKCVGYAESETVLESFLGNPDSLDEHFPSFQPDNQLIYQLIRQIPYATRMEQTRETVDILMTQLLTQQKFLISNRLIAQHFPAAGHSESTILENASTSQKQEYHRLKQIRESKSDELGNRLLALEQKKCMNISTTDRYFRNFGNLELKRAALDCRIAKFKEVLSLKLLDPMLCFREALKMADETISHAVRTQNALREKYARAVNLMEGVGGGSNNFSSGDFIDYETACKLILKRLYRLLHPDTSSYQKASEPDRKRLDQLWQDLLKTTEEKLVSYGSNLLLNRQPDYYRLKKLLHQVCEILEVDPDDLDEDPLVTQIKMGSSIDELIDFLKSDIENLQLHLTHLELVQYKYTSDRQAQYYREALLDTDAHTEKLESDISKAQDQISVLKADIRMAFKNVAA